MIRPLKSLGQHFLRNPGITEKIVAEVARLHPEKSSDRPVLEIGPGPGALTEELLRHGFFVIAVEIDGRMVEALTERFAAELASGRLRILERDAMKLKEAEVPGPPRLIVGNLPYNVGTPLVFHFLESFPAARSFCFMLQKEVVERFKARENTPDYGVPSVKFRWSCDLESSFPVSPGSFSPPPRVDSMVFSFRRKDACIGGADPLERGGLYDEAAKFLEGLFQQRRKMLRARLPWLKNDERGAGRVGALSAEEILNLHLEDRRQKGQV